MITHQRLAAAVCIAMAAPACYAQEAKQDLETQVAALAKMVTEQQAEISRLRGQVETLELEAARGRGLTAAQDPPPAGTPPEAASASATAKPEGTQDAPLAIGQERQKEQADQREQDKALVVREHAPLFERKFTVDVGGSYSYYDRRQLALSGFLALDAIFLGTINLDQSKASLFTTDVTGRYGLSRRLSVEANIPYVYRDTTFISGGAGGASGKLSEYRLSGRGIGDASMAAYYQLTKESARWPDIVASVRVRVPTGKHPFGIKLVQPDSENTNLNIPESLPTGTGFYSTSFNVSALRTYDPVILFGSLGYTYNVKRKFDDISPVAGQVSPATVYLGNPIQISTGMAIALNDRAAVSFSVAAAFSGRTHVRAADEETKDPVVGSNSNSATFNMGATYVLPSGWTMNGQLGVGLTPDAPNYVIGLRASRSL